MNVAVANNNYLKLILMHTFLFHPPIEFKIIQSFCIAYVHSSIIAILQKNLDVIFANLISRVILARALLLREEMQSI